MFISPRLDGLRPSRLDLRQIFGDWPWATPQDFEQSALCVLSSEHVQYIVKHEYARNQAKESLPKATIKMMAGFFHIPKHGSEQPEIHRYYIGTWFWTFKTVKTAVSALQLLEAPAVSWFNRGRLGRSSKIELDLALARAEPALA